MDVIHEDNVDYAQRLDNNDKLGHFRNRFYLDDDEIYMCGNSLGLASRDAEDAILNVIEMWKKHGVKIWNVENSKFYLYSSVIAELMAPLVGADKEELVLTGSTTVSLHQAISTLYKPNTERYKILVDDMNFPTDRYAVDSQVRLKGYNPEDAVKVVKFVDNFLNEDHVIEAMTPDVALVLLPTVFYKNAQIVNMKKITEAAKERGIIIGWDMCHAVGAIDIDLKSLDADFAVWCTYKYLNGGPGSTSVAYCNRRHFDKIPGLCGWFGNNKQTQFLLLQQYDHEKDASGWQIGTPNMFSMATLEGSLKTFLEAGIVNIRKKSLLITDYMMFLMEKKLSSFGFTIGNSKIDSKRGGHICLKHDEGYRISLDLKSRGVVPDFREPNMLRLTPAALYTRYIDVYNTVEILLDIVKTESFKQFVEKRALVV